MAKKPTITTVASGFQSTATINNNFQNLKDAFDNTLSLDGSTPNAMNADLDMNGNDIINVGSANGNAIITVNTGDARYVNTSGDTMTGSLNTPSLYTNGLYINGNPVLPDTLSYNGIVKETKIATSGQTVFNLSSISYTPGINNLAVYVDGVYQRPANYTETNSTRVTFSVGIHVGGIVDFVVLTINSLSGTADAVNLTYTPSAQSLYGTSTLTLKSALDQISNEGTGSSKVGFLQSGTGATNRTAQAKFRETVSVKDFGAIGDNSNDDTAAFVAANAAVNYASGFNAVNGTYLIDNVELAKANVYGPSVIKPVVGATSLFTLGQDPSTLGSSDWRYRRLVDLYLSGNSKSANGITFKNAAAGRWRIDNCFITACDKGFYKPYGNIANELLTTTINSCNYGYWATSSASPVMHAGNDRIMGSEISNCSLAAIYINSPQSGTGGTVIDKTIIEDNPGFGLFVKNWNSSVTPLKLRDVWFENNATSGPVTIDGVSYTPRDIYMENVNYAVIDGSPINKTEFVNSQVLLDNCFFDDTANIINTTSSITIRQANTNGLAKQNVTVESLSNASRATSGFADFFRAVPRANVVYTAPLGTTLYAENFADAGTYTLGGTTSITSTAIADGILFSNCAEFSIPNGNVNVVGNFTLTSGKFIVYTMDIKQIAATQISVVITGPSAVTTSSSAAIFKQDQWVTIGGVAPVILSNTGFYWQLQNTSGSAKTFRLGPVQVIQFDALSDALTYFNNRMVVTG